MSENGMEQKYVKEAFDANWVVPLGPNVNGFEKDLEEFVSPTLTPPGREGGKEGGGVVEWYGSGALRTIGCRCEGGR